MALTFPRQMTTAQCWARAELRLQRRQEIARTAGAATQVKDLGPPLWVASFESYPLLQRAADALHADFETLGGAVSPFFLVPALRRLPAVQEGSLVGLVGAIRADRRALRIEGFSKPGRLMPGDFASVEPQGGGRELLRVATEGSVSSAGLSAWVEVVPAIRPAVSVGDRVSLRDPEVEMILRARHAGDASALPAPLAGGLRGGAGGSMRARPVALDEALRGGAIGPRDFLWVQPRRRSDGARVELGFWSDLGTILAPVIRPGGGVASRPYEGAGSLIGVSSVAYTTGLSVQTVAVRMSQIALGAEVLVRGYDARRAPVEIHRGYLDPRTGLLFSPAELVFHGFVDEAVIDTPAEGGEGGITLTVTGPEQELTRSNAAKRSDADQRLRHPDDAFFADAATVGTWKVFFGQTGE